MKPLLAVAVISLILSAAARPDNIEQVKELPQSKEPVVEAEESEPQARSERCTSCGGGVKLGLKSPNEVLAAFTQGIPAGAEVHTQQSFEGCSSDKGCAGLKVKDGQVVEKFGNVDAFRAAAAADTGNEFQFHAGGFDGAGAPFWWMNQQNSPFKNSAGGFEKFSKSSSSFSSSGSAGGAVPFLAGGAVDLAANPFLNGDLSKLGANFGGAVGADGKPGYSSSSFESSSFSTSSKGDVDLAKNPFLNGGIKLGQNGFAGQGFGVGGAQFGATGAGQAGQSGQSFNSQSSFSQSSNSFGGQGFGQGAQGSGLNSAASQGAGFGASGSFNAASANKFGGSGYTGSSPSPFTASAGGSNVNLIQNTQKTNEFEFDQSQQTQQNVDEAFQSTGNVLAHEHSGGDLQQTCAGQGYVCVHKAQCNNGVVNSNGAGILQAKTQKQYCNTRTEICCRIEVSTLSGAGGLQGSLGVGSATYQGSGSQGSGLFVNQGQSGQAGSFGAGQSSFSQNGQSAFGANSNSFGAGNNNRGFGQGTQTAQGSSTYESSSSSFGSNSGTGFQSGASGAGNGFQSGSNGFQAGASFGAGSGSVNRGVTGTSSFESGSSFNSNKFGSSGSNYGNGFSTAAPTTNRFGAGGSNFNNDVYKSTSQSNFVETDSFSSGSENVFRPGVGPGLKPGIPYLPPDNVQRPSVISSTAIPTTPRPRPTTAKPTYLPPTSTSAPGYLPPVQEQSTNVKEVKVPQPVYNEGTLILEANRQPLPKPTPGLTPNEIPAGCAAALKCTPIEFCTAEGVISNTTVALTRDQEAYRVPLTDCKHLESGRIGKCCRDPLYTDPWPTNQLGKWVPNVFGGNDGKYVPDNRQGGSIPPQVTVKPPTTGSVVLNFVRPKPTVPPYGPNQVTPGFPSTTSSSFNQKGQFERREQGSFGQGGQVQIGFGGQGQTGQAEQGGLTQFSQGSSQTQFNQGGQTQFSQQGNRGQVSTVQQGQFGQGSKGQFGQGSQGQFSQGSQSQFNQVQGQFGQGTQGQFEQGSQGQFGQGSQGQFGLGSQGQFGIGGTQIDQGSQFSTNTQTFGQRGQQGQTVVGQGQFTETGQGSFGQGGKGQFGIGGAGQIGFGGAGTQEQVNRFSSTSQTKFSQGTQKFGQGNGVVTGEGQGVSQGFGQNGAGFGVQFGIGQAGGQGFGQVSSQRQGQLTSQGFAQAIVQGEAQSGSNEVYRVFLDQYGGNGQCGTLNAQKPYGNHQDLEVDFAEIPWQAMVLLQTNRSLLCGGVITRPDVVITSASCVEGLQAKNVLIKGGEWKLGIDDEPLPFQIVQVKTILRHPYYKAGSLKYDAAILVLSENLRLAKNIFPICLPGASETLDAFYNGAGECIVTGWGKQVLQAHLEGAIMHSLNVSLLNPGECESKLSQDYPHLLEQYDQESCACGQPLNPVNNICKVDTGSALACSTDNTHFVLRGIYSWDSGCQTGNQLAAFYKFDLEWYEWAIGLIESSRFAAFSTTTKVTQNRYSSQINSGVKGGNQFSGVKGGASNGAISGAVGGVKGFQTTSSSSSTINGGFGGAQGVKGVFGGFGGSGSDQFGFSQFGQSSKFTEANSGSSNFGTEVKGPISKTFSASYSEKKVFQTEPKIISYTTKPEIVTFTTKPEYFTYTTKPKYVTFTTKPQVFTYETTGSGTNPQPQYVAPGVSFNPTLTDVAGHKHSAQCKCLEKGKK